MKIKGFVQKFCVNIMKKAENCVSFTNACKTLENLMFYKIKDDFLIKMLYRSEIYG